MGEEAPDPKLLAARLEAILDRLERLEVPIRELVTSPTVEGKEFVVRDERGEVRARLEVRLSFPKIYTVRFGETFHGRTLCSQPFVVVM
jgi:hypothetical protein